MEKRQRRIATIGIIIFLFLISGCTNSYDSCVTSCMGFKSVESCTQDSIGELPEYFTCRDSFREPCHNECKPK